MINFGSFAISVMKNSRIVTRHNGKIMMTVAGAVHVKTILILTETDLFLNSNSIKKTRRFSQVVYFVVSSMHFLQKSTTKRMIYDLCEFSPVLDYAKSVRFLLSVFRFSVVLLIQSILFFIWQHYLVDLSNHCLLLSVGQWHFVH